MIDSSKGAAHAAISETNDANESGYYQLAEEGEVASVAPSSERICNRQHEQTKQVPGKMAAMTGRDNGVCHDPKPIIKSRQMVDETTTTKGRQQNGLVTGQQNGGAELMLNPSQIAAGAEKSCVKRVSEKQASFEQDLELRDESSIRELEQKNKNDSNNSNNNNNNLDDRRPSRDQVIKVSRKRYFILVMFVVLQMIKSFQWICLASITNVVAKYYDVDNLAINWTTILFMVTYLILAMPTSWIMGSIGLRRSVLIGTLGVTLGVTIKCFTSHRGGFALSMLGHLIVGITEPFFFSSYAQVASVWFPDDQVALATAASLIGEQTGLALGFIIPPLVIGRDPSDFEAIQRGLFNLFLTVAVISIANTLSIVLFFDEEPKFAPGIARFKQKKDETIRRQSQQLAWLQQMELRLAAKSHKRSPQPVASLAAARNKQRRASTISRVSQSVTEQVKLSAKFMTNRHFIMLLIGFGINQGISYSTHTLLNQMIVKTTNELPPGGLAMAPADDVTTPDSGPLGRQQESAGANVTLYADDDDHWTSDEANIVVGNAGLILILAGLVGSGLCGYVLDRYHRYKLTTLLIYLLTLVAMAALTGCLLLESATILYLAIIPLGFAQTGYAGCAFDYGVELTYPKPELLSSTLLNMSAQLFGIPISLAGSLIVDAHGSLALGAFFCLLLALGLLITCLQGGELRRQTAVNECFDQSTDEPAQCDA